MGEQWKQFLTFENFNLALRRLQTANSTLYKSLYYPDLIHFAFFEKENIDFTIHLIKEQRFEPKPCSKFYIPKKKNLARPLSLLSFIDLLVYKAIINIIADQLYDKFFPHQNRIIFGNIYRKSADKDAYSFFSNGKINGKNTISKLSIITMKITSILAILILHHFMIPSNITFCVASLVNMELKMIYYNSLKNV